MEKASAELEKEKAGEKVAKVEATDKAKQKDPSDSAKEKAPSDEAMAERRVPDWFDGTYEQLQVWRARYGDFDDADPAFAVFRQHLSRSRGRAMH